MYESFTCLQPKHLAGWHVQAQAVWQGKESQNMLGVWHTPLNRLFIINISLIYCHLVHDFGLCACPFEIKMHSFMINWTKHALNQWSIDITKYNPNYTPVLLHFSNFWGQSPEAASQHPSNSPPHQVKSPVWHEHPKVFVCTLLSFPSIPLDVTVQDNFPQLHLNCCKSCSIDKST